MFPFLFTLKTATIISGSNSGDRQGYLFHAKLEIEKYVGKIIKSSTIYESESWGYSDPTNYYNQVISVRTKLTPQNLLKELLDIESRLDRVRLSDKRYSARTIDLDILFYEQEIINSKKLVIPHPKIQFRRFVLLPLAELIPDYIHPVLKKNVLKLLEECTDNGSVTKITSME